MRHGREGIEKIVNTLLSRQSYLTAGQLSKEAGVSRQAAHRHLAALAKRGLLHHSGKGRASRYEKAVSPRVEELRFQYPLAGLNEDRVWKELRPQVFRTEGLPDNVERILHYSFTELVNNAIDHSQGSRVNLVFPLGREGLLFEVVDDGIGAFERLKTGLGLKDAYGAVQELSKGKATTDPKRHTGEGIFFTSKAADYFELEANGLVWRIDNHRKDMSIAEVPARKGTRVRFEISPHAKRTLVGLFDEYTTDYEFAKTRVVVRLFEVGVRFVSRSEAKRLLQGLDRFTEVVLDFKGVEEVGQGFADEVFRVWSSAHPGVTIRPENMVTPVEFMVKRAQRDDPKQ